jgi:phosphatidylglycerophosphatase A
VLVLGLAFLFFRVLDILKPWPISRLERYSGGLGIMLDDVAAGIVAGALVAVGIVTKLI